MPIQSHTAQLKSHFSSPGRIELVQAFDPVEVALGSSLPADYKYFLMWANGGETLPPLKYYRFYPLEELLPRRADGGPPQTLEVATNDSEGFALDLNLRRRSADYPIVSYPLGDTTRESTEFVADNFEEFLGLILRRLQPRREL